MELNELLEQVKKKFEIKDQEIESQQKLVGDMRYELQQQKSENAKLKTEIAKLKQWEQKVKGLMGDMK